MHRPIAAPATSLLLCVLLSLPSGSGAQVAGSAAAAAAARVPRVFTTPNDIRLDGLLDEAEYAQADSIWEFRQKEPVEGGVPSERTVVRLLATPKGLVVAWWVYDRNVAGIVRTQLRRDAELRSDDYVSLMVDGLSDKRSAFYFRTNSNGAMWDGEHVTFESGNEEWDGIWDVRTQIHADGWTAEMLIPWETLRYPDDVTQMGMNFRRFLPRTNEELLWRAWRRTEGLRFLEREGTVAGFADLPPRARAEFRPYVLGQAAPAERTFAPNGSSTAIRAASAYGRAGLDVKLPLTRTLTMDLTANPDFAQADVDRQIVNLTRFPLFFPSAVHSSQRARASSPSGANSRRRCSTRGASGSAPTARRRRFPRACACRVGSGATSSARSPRRRTARNPCATAYFASVAMCSDAATSGRWARTATARAGPAR